MPKVKAVADEPEAAQRADHHMGEILADADAALHDLGHRGGDAGRAAAIGEIGLDPDDALLSRTLELTNDIAGFPRHLSQHVGGFVLTKGRLDETVPIGNAAMDDMTNAAIVRECNITVVSVDYTTLPDIAFEASRMPKEMAEALRGLGWHMKQEPLYSGTHVIQVTPQGLVGGADPREEGKAEALPAPR